LALEDAGTKRERWKARFVVQVHRDKMKLAIVHDTATLSQRGTRLLFCARCNFWIEGLISDKDVFKPREDCFANFISPL
jgi:hypothetical protein